MEASGPVTPWHALPAVECLRLLGTTPDGLSGAEAQRRRAQFGPNLFTRVAPVQAWHVLLAQFRGVLTLLLVLAAAVAVLAGDRLDAAAIGAVLLLNVTIGFLTELRAHRAMEALLGLEVGQATLLREGGRVVLPAAEVVPGDVIVLEAGDAVPADARLLAGADLFANEAPLTGESVPAGKTADEALEPDAPLADRRTMVFKGTVLTSGSGHAVVVATGMRTEVGRIGTLAAAVRGARSPLEIRLEALGRRLAVVAVGAAAVTASVALLQGAAWSTVIGTALALAVAAVPEGLPVVATIAMAVGVRRMARRRALVRNLPAVEALGSVTLVCSDKTGTLTAGDMMVTEAWLPGGATATASGIGYDPAGWWAPPPDGGASSALGRLLTTAVLASHARLVERDGRWLAVGDPTEAALLTAAARAGLDPEALRRMHPSAGEVPFASARMFMAVFVSGDAGLSAHVKGAPHRVAERCCWWRTAAGVTPLDAAARARIEAANAALAARGLRVLACATGPAARPDVAAVADLEFLGLVGMLDPPAAGVPGTLATLRHAGLRTMMVTGDQRLTAEAIARDLGLMTDAPDTLDGAEVEQLSDADLATRLAAVGVVSRVSPETKLRLVRALQARGEVVAMLGDGVNDAAALRQADVGVAMGGRGTDLAKEAADVILQDDRFETITAAVEEGRVVFENIRKFVFYLFSCNLAEILVMLGASLAGFPAPLAALQILWLNLVTDTFPALALAVEPADPDLMRRPPRAPREGLIPGALARETVGFALVIALVSLAAFAWGLHGLNAGPAHASTLAFSTLALAQAFHLGNARSALPVLAPRRVIANRWALASVLLVCGLQWAAVSWAPLAELLRLTPVPLADWLVVGALGLLPAVAGQAVRLLQSRSARLR